MHSDAIGHSSGLGGAAAQLSKQSAIAEYIDRAGNVNERIASACNDIERFFDRLRGPRPADSGEGPVPPMPSGQLHQLGERLNWLEGAASRLEILVHALPEIG